MKKYLLGIFAAIMAIAFSAFTVSSSNPKTGSLDTYVWHKYNAAGTVELSPIVTYTGTADGAKTAFGCPDGTSVNCASAYDLDGNPLGIYVKKTAQ